MTPRAKYQIRIRRGGRFEVTNPQRQRIGLVYDLPTAFVAVDGDREEQMRQRGAAHSGLTHDLPAATV